jgi:hypothetical protein
VEDLGQVESVPNIPLYYLSDALGSTVDVTNMNAGIIDNNRFAPYGEPISMLIPTDLHGTVRHTGGAPLIKKGLRP